MRLIARQGHADRLVLRLTVGSDEVAGGNGGRVRLIALLQYCRSEINQQQKEHISRTVAPSLTAGPWSWEALTGYSVRMWGVTFHMRTELYKRVAPPFHHGIGSTF